VAFFVSTVMKTNPNIPTRGYCHERRTIMKRFMQIVLVPLLIVCFAHGVEASDLTRLIQNGMQDLKNQKGSPALLALTDATYVKVNGKTSEGYVDIIQEITGCSIGKRNLLFFHRPVTYPLKVVLFNKDTKDAVVTTYDGKKTGKINVKMDGDEATKPDGWKQIQEKLGPDTFSLVTITNAWAKGAPYDFLRCCEFHNHLCPGVSTGYQIAQFIMEKYPLRKGESYVWIACPPWCKDDAMQILLDLTPGKRSLFVKNLTAEQKKALPGEKPTDSIAGIVVVWNNKANKGKAVALRYDWARVWQVSGVKSKDFKPKGGKSNPVFWTTRVKCNWGLMPYLTKAADFVKVVKEVELSPRMYTKMTIAGVNPYEVIGLSK
jgi:formylmethanofuran dehydrogenase subunit E-like metal-binding protein